MLPFDAAELFIPEVTARAYWARTSPHVESLADMAKIRTIVPGPSDKYQALEILKFFNLSSVNLNGEHSRELFWDLLAQIRQQVFKQLFMITGEEYRLDWSREDQSFCLWYRHRDTRREATRDLNFVRQHTLANLLGTEIRQESQAHGFGLFATDDLSADVILGILDGQEIHYNDYDQLHYNLGQGLGRLRTYFFMEWNVLPNEMLLARPFRTFYSYINHSSNPNVRLVHKRAILPYFEVITIRNIARDEEIYLDYTKERLPLSYFQQQTSHYLKNVILNWEEEPAEGAKDSECFTQAS